MKNNDIPALVKELRERLHLTQEQFAHKVGVTYSTVNHWENGKRIPQPFLVKRLIEIRKQLDKQENKRPKAKSSR
jgi:DNA-binding transcriptional regulator YiaG